MREKTWFIFACLILSFSLIPASFSDAESTQIVKKSHKGRVKKTKTKGGDPNVKGYTKKNGKSVSPHKRTGPNKSRADNWSSKGNSNPLTGKKGSNDPYKDK